MKKTKPMIKLKPVEDKDFYAVKNAMLSNADLFRSQTFEPSHYSVQIPEQNLQLLSLRLFLDLHQSGSVVTDVTLLMSLNAAKKIANALDRAVEDYLDSLTK